MTRVHLRSLKLAGFKSFPDPVELDFGGNVCAIIGPNGCGKSNLVDAVLFVLGEQSPSRMRLKSMGDLVFSGSSQRAPAGAAEVTMVLGSDDGRWAATDNRLELKRRVFRTGPSEYRVNGKAVRLKDLLDELMAVGLGTRNYSIIEQGRVGQVLSARPTDRRALLEEAAGITHYKARRHEAELKLEHTRQNLLRIEDVIAEVDRSLRQLKRQAKQADRHQKMETELKDRLRRRHRVEARQLDQRRREIARRRAQIQNELAAAAAALGSAEADLGDARQAQEQARVEVEKARAEVAELLGSRERIEAFLERSEDLIDSHRAALERARREQASLETSRGATQEAAAEAARRLQGLAEARARVEAEVEQAAVADREALERLEEVEQASAERRQELLRTISALTDARNRLGGVEREQDRLGYSIGQLEQELARQEERRHEVAERYRAASEESRTAVAAAEALSAGRQELVAARSETVQQTAEAKQQVESLSHTAWELRHRLAGIDRELARHTAALEQVRAFLPDEAVRGQVSDYLDPDPRHAARLDRVWAEELELPVVELADLSPEQLRSAAELEARVRVVVAAGAGPSSPCAARPGAIALLEVAGIDAEHRSWLERVLPPAYACADPEQARRLAEEHPAERYLDDRGVLWRGRVVEPATAGSGLRGTLALKVDQEELRLRLAECEQEGARASDRHHGLLLELEELNRRLSEVESRAVAAEQARARATAVEQSISQELGRLERDSDAIRAEVARNRELAAKLAQRRDKLVTEVAALDRRGLELEKLVEETSATLDEHRDQRAEALRRLDRWRAEAKLAGEREAAARGEAERLAAEHRQLVTRIGSLREEAAKLAAELERTETEVVRSRARLAEEHALLAAARDHERKLAERVSALGARVGALDAEVRSRRQAHEEVRDALHAAELERTRAEGEWATLGEATLHDLAVAPEQLLEGEAAADDDPAALDREIAELRRRIEAIGPVNLLALKEVDELEERARFLKEQRDDLVESLKSLDTTIGDIDATCTERFVDTFEKVNVVFAETFSHLFGGGSARLELVDEDDPLESGIDIVAQPPGKKTQSVQLLSGGEKALAALSLLIALFRVRPSPFCILDEVDAPLDDANVERLGDLVRAMTDHTQFILVTHNRRTMARADVLYGVTMERAGVSKLVSVRLEE